MESDNLIDCFGSASRLGYENGKLVRLLDAVQRAADPEETDRTYRAMLAIFQVDVPVTVLSLRVHYVVVDRRVIGLRTPLWDFPMAYVRGLRFEGGDG